MITMSTTVPRPMYMADSLLRGLECPAVPAGSGFMREEAPEIRAAPDQGGA